MQKEEFGSAAKKASPYVAALVNSGFNLDWLKPDRHAYTGGVTYGHYTYDHVPGCDYIWDWIRSPHGEMSLSFEVRKLNLNSSGLGCTLSQDKLAKLLQERHPLELRISVSAHGVSAAYRDLRLDAEKIFGTNDLSRLSAAEIKDALCAAIHANLSHIYETVQACNESARKHEESRHPSRPHDRQF